MDTLHIQRLDPEQPALRIHIVFDTPEAAAHPDTPALRGAADGLRQRGHRLELIQPRGAAGAGDAPTLGRYAKFKRVLHLRRLLIAHWSRQRPDLVHIDTQGPLGWAALQAAGKLRIPVSASFPGEYASLPLSLLHKPLAAELRKFFTRVRATLVAGRGASESLRTAGLRNLHPVAQAEDLCGIEQALRSAAR